MPVKRRAAKERRPQFAVEVLELFREIETIPERARARWEDDARPGHRLNSTPKGSGSRAC
jgi:hypothetical protein